MQEPAASGKLEQEEPNETTKDLAMKPFDARQELRKQLSEESEAGGEKSILSIRSPYLDDLDYNQRLAAAEALGGVALNTYAWDFAYYILDMKKKLRENTFPPVAFTRFGMISGETVLTFKVWPDGSATDIEVIGYEGHKTLMETSVDAVKDASPFAPLPDDFPEEYLELRWTFIYFVYR
jgi:outer membrane biosynthesis protein TonB